MVMKVAPLEQAIRAARAQARQPARVIYLSPQGRRFDHRKAVSLARESALVLIAGRYEGIDARSTRSYPSAITCSQVASWRPWWSWTR